MPGPVTTGARCALHPETQAVDICSRCGAFVCPQCLELREETVLCTPCHSRVTQRPSTRAVTSLVLAILGVTCGLLPGVIGLVLAIQELSAIERGEAPPAGKSIATGAKLIGFVSVGLAIVMVLLVAAIFLANRPSLSLLPAK